MTQITHDPFDPKLADPFARGTAPVQDGTATGSLRSLELMSVDQLLEMRRRIEELLPVKDLKDMNLARELVLQAQALQALQQRVIMDDNVPANQQAQCANSLSSALVNLVKVQTEVYTSERLKTIENILIECLGKLPLETQDAFLTEYECVLGQ